MATVTLVDFEDIYTAICEELKIQLTDGATVGRIKRDINMIYLNEVIPFKPRAWWWLKKRQDIQTYEKIETGTVSTTDGSTTVTFSSAPSASSVAGYYFKIEGYPEIIEISAHTGGATTATLTSAWQRGTLSAQGYTLWRDYVALDSDMKEIVQVTHDKMTVPLESVSSPKFYEKRARMPNYNGFPVMVMADDFDTNGSRVLRWFPSCDDTIHTMHVEGVQEATRLSADSDEPMMPVEDRIVLYYGACSRAWSRERNESEAQKNWTQFMMKLNSMAAKGQDAPKKTEMSVDPDYTINKRYRRLYRSRRSTNWRSD